MAKLFLGLFLSLFLLLAHGQASAEPLVIGQVGNHHVVTELPHGWVVESVQPSSAGVVTVRLTQGSAPDAVILLSVLQPPADSPFNQASRKTVHEVTSVFAEQASAQSIEGTLMVNTFESGHLQGAYFSATDKAPPPGDFKYLSRGTAALDGIVASFTALSNLDATSARDTVLQLVKALRAEANASGPSTP